MTDSIDAQTSEGVESFTADPWVRVSRVAAFSIGLWSIVLQVVAGQPIPPVAILGIVFATLGLFLTGDRRALAAVSGGLAIVAIGGNVPGTIDDLSHPSSASAFILTVFVSIAVVVLVVAGVASLTRASQAGVRSLMLGAGSVVVAAAVVGIAASSGVDSVEPLGGDIQVIAKAVEFAPTEISVGAGAMGFWVHNQDGIRHTFTIEGTAHEIDVPGFSAQRAVFELDSGQYTVICRVPGHENMRVNLTVVG